MFAPRRADDDLQTLEARFREVGKAEPDRTISTESHHVLISTSPGTRIAVSSDGQVVLILHGEIYVDEESDQAQSLLDSYTKVGISFASKINGSFAVLLVDKRIDLVALITDRLNTRKLFWSKSGDLHWLSTVHTYRILPTHSGKPDLGGVASYLVNRAVLNNRTLLAGIGVLDRASIHFLKRMGLQSTRYWHYGWYDANNDRDEEVLRAELSNLLIEGVRRRINGSPKVFVSLSGGYDSTVILGALAELGVRDVECFSYVDGAVEPDTDAFLARQMACHVGYRHTIVPGYRYDLMELFRNVSQLGQGLTGSVYEADAWKELADRFCVTQPGILFVGDECFGWQDGELSSRQDVLNSVGIRDFSALDWLRHLLPQNSFDALRDALAEEIEEVLKRCPVSSDYHDSKDFLYLDQRLGRLLAWRECFAAPFIDVRFPLLDNQILDFMTRIPSSWRRGKQLYKHTATQMFPTLFRVKRAATANIDFQNWERLSLVTYTSEIDSFLSDEDSALDELIPPELISRLLGEIRASSQSLSLRRIRRQAARMFPKGSQRIRWAYGKFRPQLSDDRTIKPARFLFRTLFLRTFFHSRLQTRHDEKE